jgi:hypothetical protein
MKVIGVGGFARCGKDTFVAIAKDILQQNGFNAHRYAFADELKREVDHMMKAYGFNPTIFTEDTDIKTLNRPLLLWWGCQRRRESPGGLYWVEKVDEVLKKVKQNLSEQHSDETVALISDVRFANEVDWVRKDWSGFFVHLRRYALTMDGPKFDKAPNDEEEKNDPIIALRADYRLEWESRSIPAGEDVMKDQYLRKKVLEALNSTYCFNGQLID